MKVDLEFIKMIKPLKDEFDIFNYHVVEYSDLIVDCETDEVGIYLRKVSYTEYEYMKFNGNKEIAELSYLLRIPRTTELVELIGWNKVEDFTEFLKIPYITINGKQMNPRDIIKPSKFEFEKLLIMFLMKTKRNKRWNKKEWI